MTVITGERKWVRYRFKTEEIADPRPLIFNPKYPWWLSGQTDNFSTILMWLPQGEKLKNYYDDAHSIEESVHNKI